MEVTDREWQLLMKRFDTIEKKLDAINGIRLWKARVTGALYIIGIILLPLVGAFVKSLFKG